MVAKHAKNDLKQELLIQLDDIDKKNPTLGENDFDQGN
ncbi:hypothetical protein HNQ03_000889 [Chryseobacterium sp. 16F]|uniref:Uncharacterized protein n=1 Tax=Frigoriflavimonas asaccharolytica TaxID=2735899 RepID=A0A8J8GA58_9FLAO|nr:hypothetical protein [Frigoriflavimonas asaccharolytica]